jgi:hypothetical protein
VLLHGDQAAIYGAYAPRQVAFVPKSLHNPLLVLCFLRPLDCCRGWIQNTQPAQQRSTDTVGLRTTTEMLSCVWMPAPAKSSCAPRSSRSPTAFSTIRAHCGTGRDAGLHVWSYHPKVRKTRTLASGIPTSSAAQTHVRVRMPSFCDVRCLCTAGCHPRRDRSHKFAQVAVSGHVQCSQDRCIVSSLPSLLSCTQSINALKSESPLRRPVGSVSAMLRCPQRLHVPVEPSPMGHTTRSTAKFFTLKLFSSMHVSPVFIDTVPCMVIRSRPCAS